MPVYQFDGSVPSSGPIIEYVDTFIIFNRSTVLPIRLNISTLFAPGIVIGDEWMARNRTVIDLHNRKISITPYKASRPTSINIQVPLSADSPSPSPTSIEGSSSTETSKSTAHLDAPSLPLQVQPKFQAPPTIVAGVRNRSTPTTPPNNIELRLPSKWPGLESRLSQDQVRRYPSLAATISEFSSTDDEANHPPTSEPPLPSTDDAKELPPASEQPILPYFIDEFDPVELETLKETVPPQYHYALDLFQHKVATETLPPTRQYDMRIDLKPDAPLPVAKLYQLTEDERKVLLETLDRELAAGRIRPSNSTYGSPMFFVPKKDGKLRMVVDYRAVNEVTIPDVYPLPLISQTINELGSSVYYSTFDLPGAYQLLRVLEQFVKNTAFRTQYGMFESVVVRDGLRNAPAVFQHFLNDVFRPVLGKGVVIYIDDILVHATTLDELRAITKTVFDLARRANLFFKASKCHFEQTSVIFLGLKISSKGIETDPAKIEAVKSMPVPHDLRSSRAFVGFVAYYRRFIPSFSKIASPITDLTKKNIPFVWGDKQQFAFDSLRKLLITAPILAHYDPTLETTIQTDASHYGWGAIISQKSKDDGLERPIAIESGKFKDAELRYNTTEKEFLAIVNVFTRNRHILLPLHSVVITDHLNLTYWTKPRQLNPRQARWVDALSQFRFKIVYRPGKEAILPDTLSRRSDYHPGLSTTTEEEYNFVQALPAIENDPGESNFEEGTDSIRTIIDQETSDHQDLDDFDYLRNHVRSLIEFAGGSRSLSDYLDDATIIVPTSAYLEDPEISTIVLQMLSPICATCTHPECKLTDLHTRNLGHLARRIGIQRLNSIKWATNGNLLFDNVTYLPDIDDLRAKVLSLRHDSTLGGHNGGAKVMELTSRDYYWLGMRTDIQKYVHGCPVCQRTKTSREKPHGYLKTLELPDGPWQHITMDFIEPLPTSHNFDSILVIVDRLTKWSIFVPTSTRLTSPQLAQLIIDHVISQHGVPESIVSDRGSKFVSKFWKHVTDKIGINLRLSTAYHPQTDGQTERINQIVEQYLRCYGSYLQDDWSTWLGLASFAYNNSIHSATNFTPFFANFGYHPRTFSTNSDSSIDNPAASTMVQDLNDIHEFCRSNIAEANKRYSKYYDKSHSPTPVFQPNDLVLLSLRNVQTRRPSKKLDIRRAGPYKVIEAIGTHAYRIDLPPTMKIHNVFHVSLLDPYVEPSYPNQIELRPGPVEIDDDGAEIYEVANILNSRNNPRTGKLEYLVEWVGYEGVQEEITWEPLSNLLDASESIEDFHLRYPDKPQIDKPRPRAKRQVHRT